MSVPAMSILQPSSTVSPQAALAAEINFTDHLSQLDHVEHGRYLLQKYYLLQPDPSNASSHQDFVEFVKQLWVVGPVL
ncbi:hypothetical protein BDN72DRAFT_847564 [Pluteus cervinus]|uniref:Uncharacterized protein n=1 Tax=Pluteus cervinus TaxID=181527 RepID=A0ACD3ADJ1_9AGAR|nr:hypothetical protein BDN72DRAFT_847564 [Pluteus cervinus]